MDIEDYNAVYGAVINIAEVFNYDHPMVVYDDLSLDYHLVEDHVRLDTYNELVVVVCCEVEIVEDYS